MTANTNVVPAHILGLETAFCNAVPTDLFEPTTLKFDDTFRVKLIEFVRKNSHIDFVYKFTLPPQQDYTKTSGEYRWCSGQGLWCLDHLPTDTGKGIYVAGSAALSQLLSYVKSYRGSNWKANDCDIFYVGCPVASRMPLGNVDMVFCKEKTIEEVLINFDLPCCRVAYDFKYNFYVSAQALACAFNGKMYLPKYLEMPVSFKRMLDSYSYNNTWGSYKSFLVNRFYERVQKYQSRGISTHYVQSDYILPWIINRFSYIEFDRLLANANNHFPFLDNISPSSTVTKDLSNYDKYLRFNEDAGYKISDKDDKGKGEEVEPE